jgi:DNA-binding ferritin-like protein (Dps family)
MTDYAKIVTAVAILLGFIALTYVILYEKKATQFDKFFEQTQKRISFLQREYNKVFDDNQRLIQSNGILEQQNKILETQLDILKEGLGNEEIS